MSDERNYPVEPMNAATLARRRDHAQRNPFGNTAEMVGHIDWQDARIAALLTALVNLDDAASTFVMENTNATDGMSHYVGGEEYRKAANEAFAVIKATKAALGASSGAGSVGNE